MAKADLFYFDKFILDYADFDETVHGEMCKFATAWDKNRKKLILEPRGSFKSSAITIGQVLWEAVKNPNIRILIDSEKKENSARFLGAIKSVITHNKTFKSLFGDLNGEAQGLPWSQYDATIATRTRRDLKEPTFSTSGVDVVKVGMHYDLIILDDPVSQNNTGSKEQIAKVIDHYRFLLSILEPTGRLLIIGTRWDYGDLYGYVIEDEYKTFDILIRQAEWDDEITGEHKYLFPARLTPEFLKEVKISQGSYIYSSQYLNECVDKETATFRKTWIKYWQGEVVRNEILTGGKKIPVNIFMLIDPALSQAATADFSAIVTVGVDKDNNLFVIDCVNERLSPFELDDKIFQKYLQYHPVSVGIEAHANQSYFLFTLPEQMKRRNIWFRIEELKPFGDKESRIRRLQPMFEHGSIFLKEEMHILEDQLLRFPFARHDDVLDALAYAPDLCYPKRIREQEDEHYAYRPLSKITGY